MSLTPLVLVSMILMSGFFVKQDNAIPILKPFQYIDPVKYAFQVYLINEYNGLSLS